MSARVMTLRRASTCAACAIILPAGSRAEWDAGSRTTVCLVCVRQNRVRPTIATERSAPAIAAPAGAGTTRTADAMDTTIGSAPDVAAALPPDERRPPGRDVRARRPRLGGLILALSDSPQSSTGPPGVAAGRHRLGTALDALVGEHVVVLHDRRMPRSRTTIDHVVIASSGVHVVDALPIRGRIAIRSGGSILRPGPDQLFVANRNQNQLVVNLARQAEVVKTAIAELVGEDDDDLSTIVRPSLCFIDSDWAWFAEPAILDDVHISDPTSLCALITEPGPLTQEQVLGFAQRLAEVLAPT